MLYRTNANESFKESNYTLQLVGITLTGTQILDLQEEAIMQKRLSSMLIPRPTSKQAGFSAWKALTQGTVLPWRSAFIEHL